VEPILPGKPGLMPTARQLLEMMILTRFYCGEDVRWKAAVGKMAFHIIRWRLAD
jgi:hypothetical protein